MSNETNKTTGSEHNAHSEERSEKTPQRVTREWDEDPYITNNSRTLKIPIKTIQYNLDNKPPDSIMMPKRDGEKFARVVTEKDLPQYFPGINREGELELTIPHALQVVEQLVKYLNQLNNQTQLGIRYGKDRDNEAFVKAAQQYYLQACADGDEQITTTDLLEKIENMAHVKCISQ